MKILKLEFRNINSLKGAHAIDFQKAPFTGNSLFAITGPTGSGKSTILDVISLALFNKVPRLDKVSKAEINRTGAILTRNQQDAMAAVTYESRSGRFRSEWSISTGRTGNLREYHMELSHADTGEILDLKKSLVPQQNEDYIGLSYNQFIKSVLLAQGEFAQFLKAKKDDRGELLEKITGTGIYRQLGRSTFEKFKTVNAEILQQQQHVLQLEEKLLEDTRKTEISAQLAEKEAVRSALEKAVEALRKQLELKEQLKTRTAEIGKFEVLKQDSEKLLQKFEKEHGLPLVQHDKLRHFAEELREWKRLTRELKDAEKELQLKKEGAGKNQRELQKCLQVTGTFTKSEVSTENITQRLQEFRQEVSALQDFRREKLETHKHIKVQLDAHLKEVEFTADNDPEESLVLLQEIHASSRGRLEEFRLKLQLDPEQLEAEKRTLNQRLKLAGEAHTASVRLEHLSDELLRLKTERAKTEARKKDLPARKQALQQQVADKSKDLEILQLKKEKQLLLATMEEHRRKLKEGEPCHLCGSLEHPYAHHMPDQEGGLDQDIRSTNRELQDLNHQLSSVAANLQKLEEGLTELHTSISQVEGQEQTRKDEFTERYGHLKSDASQSWEDFCRNLEGLLQELEECGKEQRLFEAVTEAIPLHKKLNEVLYEGKDLKRKLDALYSGTDLHKDCQELQNNWLRNTEQQNYLKTAIEELQLVLDQKGAKLRELVGHLESLREHGFATLEEAFGALLPEQRYLELQQKREQLKSAVTSHATSLQVLQDQLKKLKENDSDDKTETLQEDLNNRNTSWKAVKDDCEELRRLLKNDAELRKEHQQRKAAIADRERKIRRWRLLNELIGDATGKKFNDFAQDLSLGQLLHLANIRLKDLSDRYRLDKPLGGEDDGLIAIDDHMGGQRRSVKTLSGGETFLLSLSLALALSDLASKNVEIDSLFIDEGFGTLDPETLDQTLDTLEKLQAESSKTIGIISHVDSLKERIGTQVQLQRNGQGYSQLEVSSK